MARFLALNSRTAGARAIAGALVGLAVISATVSAQQPMTMQATAPPPAAPAKAPTTNAPPVLPPDTLGQYGKILVPGDQVAHPLKLRMPFPGIGEVKIPTQDEMIMRDKLEELAKLSDADIHAQLDKWPAYGKMSLRDQGGMLQRIQDFRDYRTNVAKAKAHDMGLLTLLPDQQAKFEKEYWDQRLLLNRDLAKQFAPIFKAREQKLMDDLYREYSAVSQGPIVQAPKAPAPGTPTPTKLATPAPVANKPAPPLAKPVATVPPTTPLTNMVTPMPPVAEGAR